MRFDLEFKENEVSLILKFDCRSEVRRYADQEDGSTEWRRSQREVGIETRSWVAVSCRRNVIWNSDDVCSS